MENNTNQLPGFFSSIWGYFTNHGISTKEKVLIAGLTLLYFVSPIDIIPDVIPVLGLVDDVSIGALVAAYCSWRNRCVLARQNDVPTDAVEADQKQEPAPSPHQMHDDAPIYDAEIVHHHDSNSPFSTKKSKNSEEDFFPRKKD